MYIYIYIDYLLLGHIFIVGPGLGQSRAVSKKHVVTNAAAVCCHSTREEQSQKQNRNFHDRRVKFSQRPHMQES